MNIPTEAISILSLAIYCIAYYSVRKQATNADCNLNFRWFGFGM